MKLKFYGADQCVTGSCHCLEACGKRILIDCGLQQGRDEVSNEEFPFEANTIDYVLVTHAHIDHSGRIPMLIKKGFQGRILTTRITANLLDIMLLDSAYIQEQEAEWRNRKGERSGAAHVEPLYTAEDAFLVRQFMTTCEYGQVIDLCEGIEVEFVDAGHLLGSACIALEVTEQGETRRIVFSGDLGNAHQPIIRAPVFIQGADYVVMESTYGDRNHAEIWSYADNLAKIIDETMARGGNVIIPSFAVGRTQELLYFIREIKDKHMVKSVPDFPVYIDSPLARRATAIFTGDLHGYLEDNAMRLVKDGTHMFSFSNLRMTESSEERRIQDAEYGQLPQGHHLRLRHVRRGPDPPPPEAQSLEAGVYHLLRGLPGRGDPGPVPAGRGQVRPAVRRGHRRPRPDRQLQGPVLPRRPGPPDRLD